MMHANTWYKLAVATLLVVLPQYGVYSTTFNPLTKAGTLESKLGSFALSNAPLSLSEAALQKLGLLLDSTNSIFLIRTWSEALELYNTLYAGNHNAIDQALEAAQALKAIREAVVEEHDGADVTGIVVLNFGAPGRAPLSTDLSIKAVKAEQIINPASQVNTLRIYVQSTPREDKQGSHVPFDLNGIRRSAVKVGTVQITPDYNRVEIGWNDAQGNFVIYKETAIDPIVDRSPSSHQTGELAGLDLSDLST